MPWEELSDTLFSLELLHPSEKRILTPFCCSIPIRLIFFDLELQTRHLVPPDISINHPLPSSPVTPYPAAGI